MTIKNIMRDNRRGVVKSVYHMFVFVEKIEFTRYSANISRVIFFVFTDVNRFHPLPSPPMTRGDTIRIVYCDVERISYINKINQILRFN